MLVRRLVVLFALGLTLVGATPVRGGDAQPPAAPECAEEAVSAAEEACASVMIGQSASPNPTPPGGTVGFAASSHPDTDCWDNLGHSWWGDYAFSQAVHEPFTWTVYCAGDGIESANLAVGVASGGGGGGGGTGGAVPAVLSAPEVDGTAEVGQTLAASPGSWTNGPTSYTYVWRRSGDLAELGRGTTLAVAQEHAGSQIRVDVLACNGTGCGSWASSGWTAAVVEQLPEYDPTYAEGSDSDEFVLTEICGGQSCPANLVQGPSSSVTVNAMCARVDAFLTRSNSFIKLWRMRHRLSFCVDRAKITRVWDRLVDGEILVPGWARSVYPWEWILLADSPAATGVWSSRSFGRIRFRMCAMFRNVGPLCQTAEPWIEVTLYGDGRALCQSSVGRIRNCKVRL